MVIPPYAKIPLMSTLLNLIGVTRIYNGTGRPVTAVKDASLCIESNDFIAIRGPSGCGKSTLLHLMGAMDRPTEGEIWLEGAALHKMQEEGLTEVRRTQVGFVFQFFYLLPTLTLLENVELPLILTGHRKNPDQVLDLIEAVGLSDRLQFTADRLSGGELQRAALARALVGNPRLLIADEPTGNLDSGNGQRVLELLRTLPAERGAAVVMATHSADAARFATQVVGMKDGRLMP